MNIINIRFFAFLLLSIHLCCTVYSQEINRNSCDSSSKVYEEETNTSLCDRYPNLSQEFSDSLEESIACFDQQSDQDRVSQINLMASLLWECSNNAQEYNSLMLDVLDFYFAEPRMKPDMFKFLEALSSQYDEAEAYNEENNPWNRSVQYAAWTSVGYKGVTWIMSRAGVRFRPIAVVANYLSEMSRRTVGITIIGGSATTATAFEITEDNLDIKLNPSLVSASLIGVEMYKLQNQACQLTEELTATKITSKQQFDELALRHSNLRGSYTLLAEEAPRQSFTQKLTLPHKEFMEEENIYAEFDNSIKNNWWKKPADPSLNCLNNSNLNRQRPNRNNNGDINLNIAGCYLEESARILNDSSPFGTEPIRFGSPFSKCSLSINLD